ncbi:YihY/virulence factor BrkB family protein [Microbacterium sp. EYE_5]|uniref:YihY/virulence factor BrkB family protein n=1 Tax=unclassified Microbacterium TaxID=2609290 RepID=UPI002006626A|nr:MULTISPECIES: YhjD/YihY/BrkB family envelope integrity protein [unclassified Microbacterium]MCK6081572.1 YihY/virulence factor BrkB family protein [Microbacterium sp. EYE_382]MCK6086842.1 YihY/virulence factor BrkB family protein [Microbacterium sp. EYE_384]MCK6123660.1 YihY/virulence factor BrkB family protein [Microbacterium sp. EYE_80]MCK6126569.1 YihY/virulence factor BrkB family protein [Microbacterium sp. EYE_79]MCK6142526.1 YihY/virulence factor BrkB family protein [Microbacterium sp
MTSDDTTPPLRERWEASRLRERLDQPIERATELTRRTVGSFPVRVWRHFLRRNGFLLAASISYQSLFALFATLYSAFAVVGLWLGGSQDAIDGLIRVVNSYIPGFIGESGPVDADDVASIARDSGSLLAVTGSIALAVAVWTAIGFVTFTRRAVRGIFGLPFDTRSFVLLKIGDLVAAILFGAALVLGAALGLVAGGIVSQVLTWLQIDVPSSAADLVSRIGSVLVSIALNSAALTLLIRFLTGTSLPWRSIIPGATAGGGALALLQLGFGFLAVYSPSNPLLATFSVVIGLLLWLRLAGIVMLVAASWIAVAATDADIPLATLSDAERRDAEQRALRVVAEAGVREARSALAAARWWERPGARRDLRHAAELLERTRG